MKLNKMINFPIIKLHILDLITSRKALSEYTKLLRTQYYSLEELREIQNIKLRKMVSHCYETVPFYYRAINQIGIRPGQINSQKKLAMLPIIDKQTINRNRQHFVSSVYPRFKPIPRRTGGSTGEPFHYSISRNVHAIAWGSAWRAWNVGGYNLGDKVAVLEGESLVKMDFRSKIYHWLNNWRCIPITELGQKHLKRILDNLGRSDFKMLYGYPTPILLLSRFMLEKGLTLKINHIVTNSEMLFKQSRETIQEAFGCEVFDNYGANDGGVFGFECQYHKGYHLSMEKCIVEVVGENDELLPNGSEGDLVLTDLDNYAMPFLRYKVGDRGSITDAPCPCGRGLRRLLNLSGRIKDFIEARDGERIDGSFFTKGMRDVGDIELFQVIQHKPGKIEIKVRPKYDAPNPTTPLQLFKKKLTENFALEVSITITDDFERGRNDKFRYILKH